MINPMSPTLARMIQDSSGNPNGNMAFFGMNGTQAVPRQPAPSPKEMLVNGLNSPLMQGYYNPYMGFNNNYNNYGIMPFQQQNQLVLTQEDLADPFVAATLDKARENRITFEQQMNMQSRIAKMLVECVNAVKGYSEEKKKEMLRSCDPQPLPSEIRRSMIKKSSSEEEIKPMKVYIYADGKLIDETYPEKSKVKDYNSTYVSGQQIERMISAEADKIAKVSAMNEKIYESSAEKKAEKAENLIDFFNNYGYLLGIAHDDQLLREQSITNVTQLYNKDEFMNFMKKNGVLGFRDIDGPTLVGNYSNPIRFKDSPNYKMANGFNRNPHLANNCVYDPDTDSVTITAPKYISDRNKRFDGLPNEINSLYQNRMKEFMADVARS